MASAPDNSSLSSDQDINRFLLKKNHHSILIFFLLIIKKKKKIKW